MREISISELVVDYNLYPRTKVDGQHVANIVAAIEAGSELPPIVIDKKSKRIIDGLHRYQALLRRYGPDYKVQVIEKTYRSEQKMFDDAMRYNATHGRNLSPCDRAHCILLAERFKMSRQQIADALHMTRERIESLKATKTAVGSNGKGAVAIKRTIAHMAGEQLTKGQTEANEKLGGMNQLFYVNQLIMLLENDLLDKESDDLLQALRRLHELLEAAVVAV